VTKCSDASKCCSPGFAAAEDNWLVANKESGLVLSTAYRNFPTKLLIGVFPPLVAVYKFLVIAAGFNLGEANCKDSDETTSN
jgi:hypothetical protein